MDALAARFNPAKSTRPNTTIQLVFTDRNENVAMHVDESVLFPSMGQVLDNPTAKMITTRATFDGLILQTIDIGAAIQSGALKFEGDPSAIGAMFGALDKPGMMFNVVTP